MKKKWFGMALITLSLLLVSGTIMACTVASPIVGKWQDTRQKNVYMEFLSDGRLVQDDGNYVITGKYELIGKDYVKFKLDVSGGFVALEGDQTWKLEVSGDTMKFTQGSKTLTFRRVR